MFINFWYTAGRSADVKDSPVKRRMPGQDFVLFRDTTGRVHCLADTCIHRGASLGLGKVKGDCIQCPYHGWQFDGAGACRRIPSLGAQARMPARARKRVAYAIPCPGRRDTKGWILDPVPLRPADAPAVGGAAADAMGSTAQGTT